jgi:hypothetical protein
MLQGFANDKAKDCSSLFLPYFDKLDPVPCSGLQDCHMVLHFENVLGFKHLLKLIVVWYFYVSLGLFWGHLVYLWSFGMCFSRFG